MNTNERLTEAARRGAQGHTSAGKTAFQSLDDTQQRSLVDYVLHNRALTEEIVRSALLASSAEEVEDILNEMGTTAAPKTFHAG